MNNDILEKLKKLETKFTEELIKEMENEALMQSNFSIKFKSFIKHNMKEKNNSTQGQNP